MSIVRKRTALMLAAVLSATAASMLMGVAPASAHDQLVSSVPAQDEHLATAPLEVVLTFSGDLLDFEGFSALVRVTDASGATWQTGDAVVDGAVVRSSVSPDMPDGAYSLVWQVVAGDGHPISGAIPFTVGVVAAESAVATPEPTAAAEVVAASDSAFPPLLRTALIGLGGALVAVVIVWTVSRVRRRTFARPTSPPTDTPSP